MSNSKTPMNKLSYSTSADRVLVLRDRQRAVRIDFVESWAESRRHGHLRADAYVLRSQPESIGDRAEIFNKR